MSRLFASAPTPAGVSTCANVKSKNLPLGYYKGLSERRRTFCYDGTALAPLPFAFPSVIGVAPYVYYAFENNLNDAVGKRPAEVYRGTANVYPAGTNGAALGFTSTDNLALKLSYLPQNFFTGSWTYALWTKLDS